MKVFLLVILPDMICPFSLFYSLCWCYETEETQLYSVFLHKSSLQNVLRETRPKWCDIGCRTSCDSKFVKYCYPISITDSLPVIESLGVMMLESY